MPGTVNRGIGGHQRAYRGLKDEWLTPPEIIQSLGEFDLDPCAAVHQPWLTAKEQWTIEDDGFSQEWFGRVWLNPPYGPETAVWLKWMADHGNGIALIFARTETDMFFKYVWERASALLFLRGRLHFYHANGTRAQHNSGGPSVLVSYDRLPSYTNAVALMMSGIAGQYVPLHGGPR